MEPTPDSMRAVLSRFVTGVTVMTTTAEDVPHGMTANALSSVSLEPPLVLVCVDRGTAMIDAVAASGCFALSVLGSDQRGLAEHFADADRPLGAAQFAGVATTTATTGAPVLANAIAHVDCSVWATYDGGDHLIVVGEIVDLDAGAEDPALIYFHSRYDAVAPPPDAWTGSPDPGPADWAPDRGAASGSGGSTGADRAVRTEEE